MQYVSILRACGSIMSPRTPCNGAIVASVIGGLASGIGSIFGGSKSAKAQRDANKTNLQIARENNAFNAQESKKQRDWTEDMYKRYASIGAQSAAYRAAGLNPYLSNVSPQSLGSGTAASASDNATMQAPDYSFMGDALSSGINAANSIAGTAIQSKSVDSQVALNKSIENLQSTQAALNKASEDLTSAQTQESKQRLYSAKLSYEFASRTIESKIRQFYMGETIQTWRAQNEEYSALSNMYQLYYKTPAEVEQLQTQSIYNMSAAFRQAADGKMTLKQLEMYPRELAIRQTMAYAATMQGRAALIGANAQSLAARGSYLRDSATASNIAQQTRYQRAVNDFWLGKTTSKDAQTFIVGDSHLNNLLRINLANNMQTFTNLTKQPELINSQISANYSQVGQQGWQFIKDVNDYVSPTGNVQDTSPQTITTEKWNRDGEYTGGSKTTRTGTRKTSRKMRGRRR